MKILENHLHPMQNLLTIERSDSTKTSCRRRYLMKSLLSNDFQHLSYVHLKEQGGSGTTDTPRHDRTSLNDAHHYSYG
jgi:hypothetical protein